MENVKHGNFWSDYDIVNNIPEVPVDNFTQLIQSIMANRYQGLKG